VRLKNSDRVVPAVFHSALGRHHILISFLSLYRHIFFFVFFFFVSLNDIIHIYKAREETSGKQS
jgi:hypothetical protein